MAHHPMWRPDSAKPVRPDAVPPESAVEAVAFPSRYSGTESHPAKQESEFTELAAKLATHGGGKIPAELSGELALDIVLNEIVEQACQYTGASGAAIALARGEEMVCRASTGGNAPELGTRLDMNSGLSGACARSRQIQRCDDAIEDPSVDAEVSRQLGMRSVVMFPILQGGELIGVFEIFSSLPAAFSDGDLRTLDILIDRILKIEQARQSSMAAVGLAPANFVDEVGREGAEQKPDDKPDTGSDVLAAPLEPETRAGTSKDKDARRVDWVTTLMGGIVVAVALLMGAAFAMHMGWLKAAGQRRAVKAAIGSSPSSAPVASAARQMNANAGAPGSITSANVESKSTNGQSASRTEKAQTPEGGLRVFENGKEIFRMQPSEAGATAMGAGQRDASTDSRLPTAGIVEVSPDAAEGSLILRVEPEYPEQALAQHVQGPVLLDVQINSQGAVQEVNIVSGSPLLTDAAAAAVRQWRFKPQTVNGRPVAMETRITLKFTLPPS